MQIVSELCEGHISGGAAQFYTFADLPNDQFASGTVAALPTDENGFMLFVRVTDNGSTLNTWPGYKMEVFNNGSDGQFGVFTPASGAILSGSGLTINPGDVFTLAAIGTTIYVLQNGAVIGSVTDTSYSSGGTALECDADEVRLSNFAIGSASNAAVVVPQVGGWDAYSKVIQQQRPQPQRPQPPPLRDWRNPSAYKKF